MELATKLEHVIKRPDIGKLFEGKLFEQPFILKFKRGRLERPAPRTQADIDRLSKGWEHKSESMRARMARIGI